MIKIIFYYIIKAGTSYISNIWIHIYIYKIQNIHEASRYPRPPKKCILSIMEILKIMYVKCLDVDIHEDKK